MHHVILAAARTCVIKGPMHMLMPGAVLLVMNLHMVPLPALCACQIYTQ
jgi:hypothetical protein